MPGNVHPEVVAQAVSQLVPGGQLLASTDLFGTRGHPVIAFDDHAHTCRAAAGERPLRRFDDVARTINDAPSSLPPSTVSLLAFTSTLAPEQAVIALRGVRVYCRTILVVPEGAVPGEPLLSEFDYLGITVASVSQQREVLVHVLGDPGRLPGSDISPAWARHREEQLYAAALQQR